MQWHEIPCTSGIIFETEDVLLKPGVYDVTFKWQVCKADASGQGSIYIALRDASQPSELTQVGVPIPYSIPATVHGRCVFRICRHNSDTGITLRVFSTSDVELIIEELRLRRRPTWSHWWRRLTGTARYGQASLTMRGQLNSIPPTFFYPVVSSTNPLVVTATWPWLEICNAASRQNTKIVLEPGDASARVIAHHLSLKPYTLYRLRAAIESSGAHAPEDRVHLDVYSQLPHYDPSYTDLIVEGAKLDKGVKTYEKYFRTEEVPPAVMLRIMALLTCTVQVEWVTLEQVSRAQYIVNRLSTGLERTTMIIAGVVALTSLLLLLMNMSTNVLSSGSLFVLAIASLNGMGYALSVGGNWYCGGAVNVCAAGLALLIMSGWWLVQLQSRFVEQPLLWLMVIPSGYTWLTCVVHLLHERIGVPMTLNVVMLGTALLTIIMGTIRMLNKQSDGVHIRDITTVLVVWVLSLVVTLAPYTARPLRGFFSECIDGFMYATAAEYLVNPAKAHAEWNVHSLVYVDQVLSVVKRAGVSATYATVNYVAGQTAEVTYQVWHGLIHACIPVVIYVITRIAGARRWASWIAGGLAAVIPVAQLPVFANSMAQSAGLVLLCMVALCAMRIVQGNLSTRGICVLVVQAGLGLYALVTVYRELLVYIIACFGIYGCLRMYTLCIVSKRWRYNILITLLLLLVAACTVLAYSGGHTVFAAVKQVINKQFPYFDEGDIRTRLSALHAFGGLNVMQATGITTAFTIPPIIEIMLSSMVGCAALIGVISLQKKLAHAALAVIIACIGLYIILAFVVPWPYALKKHLSVCALMVAFLSGMGCEWLLSRRKRWVATLSVLMMTILVVANTVITWQVFSSAARLPHYFDTDSQEMRTAVQKNVPSSAILFVDTDERIEKYLFTLRHHHIIDVEPNKASYCLLKRNRRMKYDGTWIRSPQTTLVFSNRRYHLWRRTDAQVNE